MCLVGPSGSGKSTLLLLLTGLLAPDEGEISINGKLVSAADKIIVPPHQRQIGMVFQTLALWPHMTIRKNLTFALKEHCTVSEQHSRIDFILRQMDIAQYENAYPAFISGGECQRVALARALILKPRIFLVDEPLSNLDQNLAEKLLYQIRKSHEDFGTTTIYVTHNQSEALAIADIVAVMNKGKIIQVAPPQEIYERPINKFVASFIAPPSNLIEGELLETHQVKIPWGVFTCHSDEANPLSQRNKKVMALIRPEYLVPGPNGPIKGKIIETSFRGAYWVITLLTENNFRLYYYAQSRFSEIGKIITLTINQPLWIIPEFTAETLRTQRN